MQTPLLFRKRIIPPECVALKDDRILFMDDDIIVTGWKALKPKKDLHHGYSCYFLKEGFKVSKFLKEDDSLIYWYCDVIKYDHDMSANSYIFTDLLADVIIYPDGKVMVVDIDEIAECLEKDLLSKEDNISALLNLDKLLKII